ncbi:MAG: hypothetical protein IJY98_02160 [Bacteroidaceae bacterium]|nr:hypothetical protein [Bacteroidaceae bacterium]
MKKLFLLLILTSVTLTATMAQEKRPEKGKRFSPEQFQAKQREFITEKARLTPEEANAFFPIYFELQKEKFRIEREARSKVAKERGQALTDEECTTLLTGTADAKIKTAELEKEYIAKYLNAVSPKKLLDIQRAERAFQGHMIKSMARGERGNKDFHKRGGGKNEEKRW